MESAVLYASSMPWTPVSLNALHPSHGYPFSLVEAAGSRSEPMAEDNDIPIRDDLAKACSRTGLLSPEAAEWMLPLVKDHLSESYEVAARAVRHFGDPVDFATKKSLGVRRNAKLGTTYLSALTDAGRKRALDAAFLVVQRAMQDRSLRHQLASLRDVRSGIDGVRILSVEDDQTCAAAKAQEGALYSLDDVPLLPLPQCDADYCRCCLIDAGHGPLPDLPPSVA